MALNIIEKFNKMLVEEPSAYESQIVNKRYGNYTDILAFIFKK
jgi:hypothetical protein